MVRTLHWRYLSTLHLYSPNRLLTFVCDFPTTPGICPSEGRWAAIRGRAFPVLAPYLWSTRFLAGCLVLDLLTSEHQIKPALFCSSIWCIALFSIYFRGFPSSTLFSFRSRFNPVFAWFMVVGFLPCLWFETVLNCNRFYVCCLPPKEPDGWAVGSTKSL